MHPKAPAREEGTVGSGCRAGQMPNYREQPIGVAEAPRRPPTSHTALFVAKIFPVLAFLDSRAIAALICSSKALSVAFSLSDPDADFQRDARAGLTQTSSWHATLRTDVLSRVYASLGKVPPDSLVRAGLCSWLEAADVIESWEIMRCCTQVLPTNSVLLECLRSLRKKESLVATTFPVRSL